jgi:hypothetical protein
LCRDKPDVQYKNSKMHFYLKIGFSLRRKITILLMLLRMIKIETKCCTRKMFVNLFIDIVLW